jgi:hypothetical protein
VDVDRHAAPPNSNRFLMAQFMMGSIVIAVLTRFATQIALYRRDA